MEEINGNLRKSFRANQTKSLSWRRDQLKNVLKLIEENKDDLCNALKQDLNKPDHETISMELSLIKNSITYALNNLENLCQLHKQTPIIQARGLYSTFTEFQPLGVVLIIGAWNYP